MERVERVANVEGVDTVEGVELVADRFVVLGDRRVIDLASGEEVVLLISTAGGATDEIRWALRCDWFFHVRHRTIAELVDYGPIGERQRFEAWRCGPLWRGSRQESQRALDLAGSFLRANGVITGGWSDASVRMCDARAVLLPGPDAGGPGDEAGVARSIEPVELDASGLRIVERRAVTALTELFVDTPDCHVRAIALCGPAGAGLRTAVAQLARVARLNGFVPLSLNVRNAAEYRLDGRSLFVIADSSRPAREWRRFLDWTLRSPKPHILLFAGHEEVAKVERVWLDRLTPRTLVDSVKPTETGRSDRRTIESAARRARGLPGRFVALLWDQVANCRPLHATASCPRAAEQAPAYGDATPVPSEAMAPVRDPSWPAPGELAALKRKMELAVALMSAGRHAPGERALRYVVAGLARRHDWHAAANGGLALARSLLRRGRPRDALQTLTEAKDYCHKAELDGAMMDVAVLSGAAWTDLGRLDEAESVLSASLAASGSNGDAGRAAASRLALARCLFWRGRYEEAGRTLAPIEDDRLTDWMAIRSAVTSSRVAIGARDLETGVARALSALEMAERAGDPSLVADAAYGVAFAHLAIGDRVAVERDVATCVGAARAGRDPLRALRARLLAAENGRRVGRSAAARVLAGRLGKLPTGSLPATVRARCALLTDLLTAASSAEVVKRHVAATGLGALELFAPHGVAQAHDQRFTAGDVVEILRLCQAGDDDTEMLSALCGLVRTQLRAAAIAFFVKDHGCPVPLVWDGSSRFDPEIAARAMAAGQALAPHTRQDIVESGVPVRYGGDTIGALVGRWTLGGSPDLGRAVLVLTTAATAGGPAVAGAIARRTGRRRGGADEIGGISPAMEEVRRSVERAAAAPFAVLIEGESGSGKELVARALHRQSPRRERPWCSLNCAALPDDLVEAELFGHARGAFTGAVAERPGVFEEAHTGTLFLDEIGELSPRAQAKLLRTIQEGEIRRVGENRARRVDVRIVSATNRDLRREAAAGRFRLDLLYRLDVVRICLPPLRDRREDIAVLVERFWRDAIERIQSRAVLSTATVAALARYDWPGNVREVQNVLASLAVRSPRRGVIPPTALPCSFGGARPAATWRLDEARRSFEERFVRAALVRTGGHRTRAADELGVTRQGLTKLMTRLGIIETIAPTTVDERPAAND